jgi:hypothetical protein
MKISEHARERWRERFNPGTGDMDQEIREAFLRSVEIFREDGDEPARYLVAENILFVHDWKNDVLVTVVDIVFGFEPGIDLEICRMQLKLIETLKEELNGLAGYFNVKTEELDRSILLVEGDIEKIRAELIAKETQKRRMLCQKQEWDKELEAKKAEYLKEVNKLRYSINYRLEMLKEKKGGTANVVKKSNKSA